MSRTRILSLLLGVCSALPAHAAGFSLRCRDVTLPLTQETLKESALRVQFGEKNVKNGAVAVGEGMSEPALLLYPDTPDELRLGYRDAPQFDDAGQEDALKTFAATGDRHIAYATFSGKGCWRTIEDIGVDMPIADVEKKNGKPFEFSGFEWDYGGRTLDWHGGTLEGVLSLDLTYDAKKMANDAAFTKKAIGDQPVWSNDKVLAPADVRVATVSIGVE